MKVIKLNKKIYTNYANGKQSIFSFSNFHSAKNCSLYLTNYKNKYDSYPCVIDVDCPPSKLELIENNVVGPFELFIENNNLSDLKKLATVLNLGLVCIEDFKFSFSEQEIYINFFAKDLISNDVFEYNHLENVSNDNFL